MPLKGVAVVAKVPVKTSPLTNPDVAYVRFGKLVEP